MKENKKNNKKILILVIVLLLLILIGTSIFFISKNKEEGGKNEEKEMFVSHVDTDDVFESGFSLTDKKVVNFCDEINKCSVVANTFPTIKFNENIPEVNNALETINTKINEYYEEVVQSVDIDSCTDKNLNYSKSSTIDYDLYSNEEYVSIKLIFYIFNVCNDFKLISSEEYVYIYDKKQNVMLTQDELRARFNVTDDMVLKGIQEDYPEITSLDGFKYYLSFNEDGKLSIYYANDSMTGNVFLDN